MAELLKMDEQIEKGKMVESHMCMGSGRNNLAEMAFSSPPSPVVLRKTASVKYNCLCSPTTHAGSFRCRYHRNASLTRNGVSVGSKLSELAGKPARIYDPVEAHS